MMAPRQNRRLRALGFQHPATFALSLALGLLAGAGLLALSASAAVTTRGHLRRAPLPPLRRSALAEKQLRAATGKRKSGKSRSGTRAADITGTPQGKSSSRRGKIRNRREPPSEEIAPLYRAHQGAIPHASLSARQRSFAVRHGRPLLAEPAPHAAALRSYGRGVSHPQLLRDYAAVSEPAPLPHSIASRRASQPPARQVTAPEPAMPVAPIVRSEPYAEGVAHPDDDERLPVPAYGRAASPWKADASRGATAHVSTQPPSDPQPVVAPAPSVVQGFGAEVAMPAGSSTERPGGTHRRNHPSNWTPEAMVHQPEALEDREAITEAAVRPVAIPELYDRDGRLVMPAPLKGSHDVLLHQNIMATNDGLDRIQDDADLDRLRAARLLLPFPASEGLRVNEALPYNRRVARPWTVAFADEMARAYYARFREPLIVTSAVRTVRFQARLQLINGNAAAPYGDGASPHLTGQAVDFGKRGMTQTELAWMRAYLLPIMQAGKIDVEEEFHQACFHISVYRSYLAGHPLIRHELAQAHPAAVQATATSEAQDDE